MPRVLVIAAGQALLFRVQKGQEGSTDMLTTPHACLGPVWASQASHWAPGNGAHSGESRLPAGGYYSQTQTECLSSVQHSYFSEVLIQNTQKVQIKSSRSMTFP